jgi:hypothetical protein
MSTVRAFYLCDNVNVERQLVAVRHSATGNVAHGVDRRVVLHIFQRRTRLGRHECTTAIG